MGTTHRRDDPDSVEDSKPIDDNGLSPGGLPIDDECATPVEQFSLVSNVRSISIEPFAEFPPVDGPPPVDEKLFAGRPTINDDGPPPDGPIIAVDIIPPTFRLYDNEFCLYPAIFVFLYNLLKCM